MKTYNKQPSYDARIVRGKDGDTILVLMLRNFWPSASSAKKLAKQLIKNQPNEKEGHNQR